MSMDREKTVLIYRIKTGMSMFSIFLIAFIVGIVGALISGFIVADSSPGFAIFIGIVCACVAGGLVIFCGAMNDKHYYDVTVEDDVNFAEISKRYTVKEIRGSIYILEEK